MATLGRPKREQWEAARALAWASAVRTVLRASPDQLRLSPEEIERWRRLLKRYESGELSPSHAKVAQFDAISLGPRQYFESPVWKLTYLPQLGKRTKKEVFADLPDSFQLLWMESEWQSRLFWRKERTETEEFADIKNAFEQTSTRLAALCAVAILIHESLIDQNRQRFVSLFYVWTAAVRRIYDGFVHLPYIQLASPAIDWLIRFALSIADRVPPSDELDLFRAWQRAQYTG